MRIFYVLVFLVCVGFAAEAAVPQLQDFDTNQFGTAGGIVRIKSGANLTNPIVANGIAPTNANYLLFDFTNSLVPIAKVLVPGANVVFSPNATGIVLSVTAAGTNGFQDPGANGVVVRVATNTSVARQILGTADQIAVDNGDGTGGDPTIRLLGPWTNSAGIVRLSYSTNKVQLGGVYRQIVTNVPGDSSFWITHTTPIPSPATDIPHFEEFYGNYGFGGSSNIASAGGLWFGTTDWPCTNALYIPYYNDNAAFSHWVDLISGFNMPVPVLINGSAQAAAGYAHSWQRIQQGVLAGAEAQINGQTNFGLVALASLNGKSGIAVGGLTMLANDARFLTNISVPTAVHIFENWDTAAPVMIGRTNGTTMFELDGSGNTTLGGLLTSLGGRVIKRFAVATNYTLTVGNHYLVSTSTQTNTLPAANAVAAGQIFIIKNKSGTTTVRPAGADTIDGVAADDVFATKVSNTYISDGVSNWEKN